MPKRVDHDRRRADISDALVRLAGREGLHSVTMRSVAVEAGISLRLVQYYFGTKARLMDFALGRLEEQSNEMWNARLAALPRPVSARSLVEAFVDEALPTDEESRTFHLVWSSFAMLSVTDGGLSGGTPAGGPGRIEKSLSRMLEEAGGMRPGLDPAEEAARLVALTHGLGTAVLIGERTQESARATLGYHLDEVFGASE